MSDQVAKLASYYGDRGDVRRRACDVCAYARRTVARQRAATGTANGRRPQKSFRQVASASAVKHAPGDLSHSHRFTALLNPSEVLNSDAPVATVPNSRSQWAGRVSPQTLRRHSLADESWTNKTYKNVGGKVHIGVGRRGQASDDHLTG